jgi:hypothetical protein
MLGCLQKMTSALAEQVVYRLPVGDEELDLNPLLGQKLALHHTGEIYCLHCNKKTKKSFNQGYCYPCFIRLAECDMCIVRPETCHFAAGTCREPEWGLAFCFQPHFVYLANSSGVKVGITRESQIPTRWIDQGAVQALPVFRVASRHISGLVEVAFGKYVSDKTSWQKMLKNNVEELDLKAQRDQLLALCRDELSALRGERGADAIVELADQEVLKLAYPVLEYPKKVKSLSFDSTADVSGTLLGIKGQYLILDSGVINIRKFAGYQVSVSV